MGWGVLGACGGSVEGGEVFFGDWDGGVVGLGRLGPGVV